MHMITADLSRPTIYSCRSPLQTHTFVTYTEIHIITYKNNY